MKKRILSVALALMIVISFGATYGHSVYAGGLGCEPGASPTSIIFTLPNSFDY